jgi:hypothetical protein
MTLSTEQWDELRLLMDALCEECITAEQMTRLEQMVLSSPEAEAFYVQFMSMHAGLRRHFRGLSSRAGERLQRHIAGTGPNAPTRPETEPATLPRGRSSRRRWALLLTGLSGAAAAAVLALLLLQRSPPSSGDGAPFAEPNDVSIAVLAQAVGTSWEETGLPTQEGTPLPAGRMRLQQGLARIEFYSGATVILEGPAELELVSSEKARCVRGKLRANVPPQASGFTIDTPGAQLVDRGTEFGVQVGEGGWAEVHVFKGQVEVRGETRSDLRTGEGLHFAESGTARPITADGTRFVSAEQLARQIETEAQRRQEAWLASARQLRTDPDLRVSFLFDEERAWRGLLHNRAQVREGTQDGAVVGCQWTEGRWPGKRALEFRRLSDRVRIHVPGRYESVTLAAWARIDALERPFNSLMLCDGWDEGAVHWQIHQTGAIILGVQGPQKKQGFDYRTPVVFTPERLGQWTHLAVTYDRQNGRVTHYMDGKIVSRQPLRFNIYLRIGNAEIGNWNTATRRDARPIRNFTGRIDEFLVFATALSDQRIEHLYQQGAP